MGKTTRAGYGYGMTESSARSNFREILNENYGNDLYQGGGNDIREWLEVKNIDKPVPQQNPNKAVCKKNKVEGKWINGYRITNEKYGCSMFERKNVQTTEEFAETLVAAREKAIKLAIKYNSAFDIEPYRLLKEPNGKLSAYENVITVEPCNGKSEQPGKWHFKVECAY